MNTFCKIIYKSISKEIWEITKISLSKKFTYWTFEISNKDIRDQTESLPYNNCYYYLSYKFNQPRIAFLDTRKALCFVIPKGYSNSFNEEDIKFMGTYEQCQMFILQNRLDAYEVTSKISISKHLIFHVFLEEKVSPKIQEKHQAFAPTPEFPIQPIYYSEDGKAIAVKLNDSWVVMKNEEGKLYYNLLTIAKNREKIVHLGLKNKQLLLHAKVITLDEMSCDVLLQNETDGRTINFRLEDIERFYFNDYLNLEYPTNKRKR